jgi:hypothetical protein
MIVFSFAKPWIFILLDRGIWQDAENPLRDGSE